MFSTSKNISNIDHWNIHKVVPFLLFERIERIIRRGQEESVKISV